MAAVIPEYQHYVGHRARRYEAQRIHTSQWQLEQSAVAKMLSRTPGMVLDIPVGTGRFADICARLGRGLIGMDISQDMMAQAKAKGVTCCYGDARAIPLPDKTVETIVCLRLLNWFEQFELSRALHEFRRVARIDLILNLRAVEGSERQLAGWTIAESVRIKANYYLHRVLV